MSRRTSTISLILGLVAAATLAVPALAKMDAEAKLDAAIPRDAQPGSTLDVRWSVFSVFGDTQEPLYGSPVFIRLVAPDGTTSTEAVGTETPRESGHYTASIDVPAGGIGEVVVGLIGESCTLADGCTRSDMIFPMTDDPLVTGSGPVVDPTTSVPVGNQLLPIVAIGVAFALVGALAAMIVGRRRTLETDPAGR